MPRKVLYKNAIHYCVGECVKNAFFVDAWSPILQIQSSVMLAIIICNYQDKESSFESVIISVIISFLWESLQK